MDKQTRDWNGDLGERAMKSCEYVEERKVYLITYECDHKAVARDTEHPEPSGFCQLCLANNEDKLDVAMARQRVAQLEAEIVGWKQAAATVRPDICVPETGAELLLVLRATAAMQETLRDGLVARVEQLQDRLSDIHAASEERD